MKQIKYSMEDFLEDAPVTMKKLHEAADEVKKSANFLKWITSVIGIILISLYTSTNIEVNKKADITDINNRFVTKQDALTVSNLEKTHLNEQLNKICSGDSVLKENRLYYETIQKILTESNGR